MKKTPDHILVRDYLNGDNDAFAEIVHRYHRPMWWVARRFSRCEHDIHDILQEAFFKASQHLDTFRCDASLKTWLHRLVSNVGYDNARRAERSPIYLTDRGELPEVAYNPMHAWDLSLTISVALMQLSPEQRLALMLVDFIGFTVNAAAEQIDVPAGTIKSRRARARRTMARQLQEV